jgi:hypothetical protein
MRSVAASLLAVVLLAGGAESAEENYYPLDQGTIWVHESRTTYAGPKETERKVFARVVTEVEGPEMLGRTWFQRLLRRYEGMPGIDRVTVFRRHADDGVHIAVKNEKGVHESLELALPPAIGRTWEYDDGVASKRSIADVVSVETPAGTFEKCLKVVRDFLTEARRKNYTAEAYFCPGLGPVRSVLTQRTAAGTVVTEEVLVTSSLLRKKSDPPTP